MSGLWAFTRCSMSVADELRPLTFCSRSFRILPWLTGVGASFCIGIGGSLGWEFSVGGSGVWISCFGGLMFF